MRVGVCVCVRVYACVCMRGRVSDDALGSLLGPLGLLAEREGVCVVCVCVVTSWYSNGSRARATRRRLGKVRTNTSGLAD